MRKRLPYLVITFDTTTFAMQMEKIALEAGKKGRLIPLPTQISAGCGLAFCVNGHSEELKGEWQEFCQKNIIKYREICEVWL